jgi:hypothetical protein
MCWFECKIEISSLKTIVQSIFYEFYIIGVKNFGSKHVATIKYVIYTSCA